MTARPLTMLCAALMLGSIFLPWFNGPLGEGTVPWDLLQQLDRAQIEQLLSDLPPESLAFLGSFVLAAILVLLGLMGSAPRLLALLTGGMVVGLVGWVIWSATSKIDFGEVPVDSEYLRYLLAEAVERVGLGAWAWLGGGLVLLLLGLFSSGRR
jgi:hypothetical protein